MGSGFAAVFARFRRHRLAFVCLILLTALILLAVFGLCLALTRYVSLSSILASAAFSISFGIMYHDRPFAAVVGVVIGLLAIFMHRANIGRLLKGTEKKATFSKFKKKKS